MDDSREALADKPRETLNGNLFPVKVEFVFDVNNGSFGQSQQNVPSLAVCRKLVCGRTFDMEEGAYSDVDGMLLHKGDPPNGGNNSECAGPIA